jgi:acyl-[acyl-carrier-protein] desaturase
MTGAPRHIDLPDMSRLGAQAVERGHQRQWSIEDLDWAALRPELLTDDDRSVVRFITLIEDHIPGYLGTLLQTFPTTGADLEIEEFCFNREYFRFLIAWANDEERHASVLTRYQVEAELNSPAQLIRELAEEGRKSFSLPYEHPLQVFTYTLVQEKATQLFYQLFRNKVKEPVLRDLLNRLARDEARHFAFYTELVGAYLGRYGTASTVPSIKSVLEKFRMPLADTLGNYWRWSFKIADYVQYDHTAAYESLGRLVKSFTTERGEASAEDLLTFLDRLRAA